MPYPAQVASAAAEGVFIGLDWGNSHHQLCILDQAGQLAGRGRFAHDAEGRSASISV